MRKEIIHSSDLTAKEYIKLNRMEVEVYDSKSKAAYNSVFPKIDKSSDLINLDHEEIDISLETLNSEFHKIAYKSFHHIENLSYALQPSIELNDKWEDNSKSCSDIKGVTDGRAITKFEEDYMNFVNHNVPGFVNIQNIPLYFYGGVKNYMGALMQILKITNLRNEFVNNKFAEEYDETYFKWFLYDGLQSQYVSSCISELFNKVMATEDNKYIDTFTCRLFVATSLKKIKESPVSPDVSLDFSIDINEDNINNPFSRYNRLSSINLFLFYFNELHDNFNRVLKVVKNQGNISTSEAQKTLNSIGIEMFKVLSILMINFGARCFEVLNSTYAINMRYNDFETSSFKRFEIQNEFMRYIKVDLRKLLYEEINFSI